MLENEIKNYIQLEHLALKLASVQENIEIGDALSHISTIESYPYFEGISNQDTRNAAVYEYVEMLICVFLYSCRFSYETNDPKVLEAINSAVSHLVSVISSRQFSVPFMPMAKTLYDLYYAAYNKLRMEDLPEYALNLEKLKKCIFHGWIPLG